MTVFVRVVSGLGNQMFQYAAARALAERHGVEVVIDRRDAPDDGEQPYGLNRFRITGREGRPEDLPPRRRDTSLAAYIRWHLDPHSPRLFRERPRRWPWQVQRYGWDPRFERLGGHVCLIGYFQSERFFKPIEPIIRREFTLKAPPPAPVARILEDMARDCAVSLHVRRGDYVRNPVFNRVHGTVGPDYYTRALELIAERAGIDPVVYAFSDDPAWVRENLQLPFETHVIDFERGPDAPQEDLRMMSACRHHIIANSTFSWWGAWLDPRPDKIVVAPKRWYASPRVTNPDILPPEWIAI